MKTKTAKTKVKATVNIKPKKSIEKQNTCKGCSCHIAKGEYYCGECMCEDDCGY